MPHAFIDESGQRAFSARSSDCFVLSAIAYRRQDEGAAHDLLEELRADLHRRSGDALKWGHIHSHSQRLRVVQLIARSRFLSASAVIVCKRVIPAVRRLGDEDRAYLYTVRYLLERLS